MGEKPPWEELTPPAEAAYYRSVEDAFARLRGTPFLLTSKDFGLLQRWWREGVPLAAVLAGMAEVFAKRRERHDDPVSSLALCRHAVQRHARRLMAVAVGSEESSAVDVSQALARCVRQLEEVARRWESHPGLRIGILALAAAVDSLPREAPPAAVDQALAHLEAGAVERLAQLLPEECRKQAEERIFAALAGMQAGREVIERTRRAVSLREWRQALGLPRLELFAPDG